MNEHLEGLNFEEAVDALQDWVGQTVRIEIGASRAMDDVMVLTDMRIRSVEVILPSLDATTGTLHIPLESEAGEHKACLVFSEEAFEKAHFFPDQEFLAFAAGSRVIVQLVEPTDLAQERNESRWNPQQRAAAVEQLEALPWGDIEMAKYDLEKALFLALDATADAASLWDSLASREGYADEFSVSPHDVAVMDDGRRLFYVARLLRSVQLAYGALSEGGAQEKIAELVGDLLLVDADLAP